jgi:phosphoenolpyruvate carboxykinase (ATP)
MLNLDIPTQVDGVDSSYLDPKGNWSDPDEYDAKAKALAELFIANIENFAPSEKILAAGPQL